MFTKEDIGKKVYIHCELSDRVIDFFPDRTGIIVGVDDKFLGAEVNVKTPGGHCWGFSHNDLSLLITDEHIGRKVGIVPEFLPALYPKKRTSMYYPTRIGVVNVVISDAPDGLKISVKNDYIDWWFRQEDLRLLPEEPKMTATSVGAPPGFYSLLEETVASISQFEADRQETIQNHRKLWNWLADNPGVYGRLTEKWQYPLFRQNIDETPENQCHLCEFAAQRVLEDDDNMESSYCLDDCIIKWPGENGCHSSISNQSLFSMWQSTNDPGWRAGLARAIAELPENPDMLESVIKEEG